MTPRECLHRVLARQRPPRFVFAPNYWQWFAHHRQHGLLPAELADCTSQLDVLRHLDVDIFSRNVYCDQRRCWFGGLADEVFDGVEVVERSTAAGPDTLVERRYRTPAGTLTESQRYVFGSSTLVQQKHLVVDFDAELERFAAFVAARRWRFDPERYRAAAAAVGERGVVIAGELFSPLKMLHFAAGADRAVYLLVDHPEAAAELLRRHEEAQLDLVRQMAAAGVPAMMAMDNLDSVFHPPRYIERYSASFYEKAAAICHQAGSTFFIHACGRQKAILPLVASLGVDGLEGVAFPPLGDVELVDALRQTGERFIITGGIAAHQTEKLKTAAEARAYLGPLFEVLRPYAHRFVLAASCNTSIGTSWDSIRAFCDAWRELAALE